MSVPVSALINLQNGTNADATQVMSNFNALVNAFTNAAAAGVNNDITQLNGITTPLAPTFGGSTVYTAPNPSSGSAPYIISATTPSNFSLTAGNAIVFKAGNTNTGPAQLNVNSTGPKDINRKTATGVAPLVGGEIVAGEIVTAVYDGTVFQLTSFSPPFTTYFNGGTSAGTNTITLAAPTDFSLAVIPTVLVFKAGGTNAAGSGVTLQVGTTTILNVLKRTAAGLVALVGGEIVANQIVMVAYDGLQYQLMTNNIPLQATRQTFTSGSGNWNPTNPGVRQLFVRMCGGGGGGGGNNSTSGNGGNGGNTSFAGIVANGGTGGTPGTGGTGGTGSATLRIAGGSGQGATTVSLTGGSSTLAGAAGGVNPFGGTSSPTVAPAANSGAGGAGQTSQTLVNSTSGAGGGAGEYVELIINNPVGPLAWAVGGGGAAGGGGQAGAAGIIIVEERYI